MMLGYLFGKVADLGWNKTRDYCLKMAERKDVYPIQDAVKEMRRAKGSGILPEELFEELNKNLNNDPLIQEFKVATERALVKTLSEILEDPLTHAFEQKLVLYMNQFQQNMLKEPATDRLMQHVDKSTKSYRVPKEGKRKIKRKKHR